MRENGYWGERFDCADMLETFVWHLYNTVVSSEMCAFVYPLVHSSALAYIHKVHLFFTHFVRTSPKNLTFHFYSFPFPFRKCVFATFKQVQMLYNLCYSAATVKRLVFMKYDSRVILMSNCLVFIIA